MIKAVEEITNNTEWICCQDCAQWAHSSCAGKDVKENICRSFVKNVPKLN